jgi:hypothetical protein
MGITSPDKGVRDENDHRTEEQFKRDVLVALADIAKMPVYKETEDEVRERITREAHYGVALAVFGGLVNDDGTPLTHGEEMLLVRAEIEKKMFKTNHQ